MNFSTDELMQKPLSEKIFLGSAVIAIISLFLPWVDIGFASVNGFQQQGYLFLIGFVYTVATVLTNKERNKLASLIVAIITLVLAFVFYKSKSESFLGTTTNFASTGLYLMIVAAIGQVVGAAMEFKNK